MYTLKGFIELPGWEDNASNALARFGELAPIRRTFAKDKGIYSDDTYPGVRLLAFMSEDATGVVTAPVDVISVVLNLAHWLRGHAVAGTLSDTETDLAAAIIGAFGTQVANVDVGTIVEEAVTGYRLPIRLRFNVTGGTDTQDVSLWFTDAEFATTYPEYSIAVIPPVADLDAFYNQLSAAVQTQYVPRTVTETLALVQANRGLYPETLSAGLEFNAYFVNAPGTPFISTVWTYMNWGVAGDNIDVIRTALQNYILDNSTHTRAEWTPILPDLFLSTEFVIVPGWNVYAIPNQELVSGLYSPQLSYVQINRLLGNGLPAEYLANEAQLQLTVVVTASMYKSLGLVTAGGPENRAGMERLNQVMTDYIVVPTTNSEFNRMSSITREWVVLLNKALLQAEVADDSYELTPGFSRVIRDDRVYISFFYDSVLYLVLTKATLSDQDVNNVLILDTSGDGTGTTVTYFGDVGYFASGILSSTALTPNIDAIDLTQLADAVSFSALTVERKQLVASTNGSRGVFGGGWVSETETAVSSLEYLDYVLPALVQTFGALVQGRREMAAVSGSGYAVFGGGYSTTYQNHLDVIDIAIPGDAVSFGTLATARYGAAGTSNNLTGYIAGGMTNLPLDTLESFDILTQADAATYSLLTVARDHLAAGSDGTTAVFGGGNTGTMVNTIDKLAFAVPGATTDFGDLTVAVDGNAAAHNATRVLFAGGRSATTIPVDNIGVILPTTPGNATPYGNLRSATASLAGTSGA